ncbi:TetR/AcrR family transcriptional regulator [Arthrobacter jiangjiafuii]|uniref:TetR/AcrR family transcriptional regulator n=1 Tax=Arthrobacter jiangjiafuii TaxID=2817475 RepID=A0A975M2Q8_9MICC|nr:TetR/AcrR family transcriptional regulator [Arthrobacter jiangjiafuii]MBP3043160.1 TetR family transcriptional regulator [Arthrobacter jiangjiafuii]QWC08714.1 TetR/AcrR family transcriptional regulator [Arthrobacter jiangjiafuii]
MNTALEDPPSPAPSDGRSLRWEAHRTERRHELIKAARRAVHALGAGASMEEIAAASGTSKSVYYRYFGDKAGLQQAMGDLVLTQMQERILAAGRTAESPRAGMQAMVSAYLQMAQTSPQVYAFVTGRSAGEAAGNAEPRFAESLSHFLDAITAMMARAMRAYLDTESPAESAADSPAGPDAPRLGAAAGFWPTAALGMVRAAGERWLAAEPGPGKPTEEQMTRQLTTWLFDGIGYEQGTR